MPFIGGERERRYGMEARITTQDMMYIALTAAVTAVSAWISIPAAVPFTLQTFAVCLTAGLLGARRATASVCIYLLGFYRYSRIFRIPGRHRSAS